MTATGADFARDWLALREPADHLSRAHGLAWQVDRHLRRTTDGAPRIVDLGAGSGSNWRYLGPRLGGRPRWRLLDNDPGLLAAIEAGSRSEARLETRAFDLAEPLAPVLADADLVTASALLDLVSADWIAALCRACARAGAAVLIGLSIDGGVDFADPEPMDAIIQRAVARDQRRDKGLGPALGPGAPACLINALVAHGYAITTQPSDWHLDARDRELAGALIDGWREAAQRQCPRLGRAITDWAERRTAATGRVRLRVGHVDVLGLPGFQSPDKSRS